MSLGSRVSDPVDKQLHLMGILKTVAGSHNGVSEAVVWTVVFEVQISKITVLR